MTTTPLQALFMMNDKFVRTKKRKRSPSALDEPANPMRSKRVQLAYRLAFGRNPSADDELQS